MIEVWFLRASLLMDVVILVFLYFALPLHFIIIENTGECFCPISGHCGSGSNPSGSYYKTVGLSWFFLNLPKNKYKKSRKNTTHIFNSYQKQGPHGPQKHNSIKSLTIQPLTLLKTRECAMKPSEMASLSHYM